MITGMNHITFAVLDIEKSFLFYRDDEHKLEIHVGDPYERIFAKRADPGLWKNVEWFTCLP